MGFCTHFLYKSYMHYNCEAPVPAPEPPWSASHPHAPPKPLLTPSKTPCGMPGLLPDLRLPSHRPTPAQRPGLGAAVRHVLLRVCHL